jgi:ribosome maturation factor RimP
MLAPLREKLIGLTEPLLQQLGYELVDLEYVPGRTHALLRVFIDRAGGMDVAAGMVPSGGMGPAAGVDRSGGVGLDDCERVSRELSALLDVEDPVPTQYTLEVSSPGFDRVLRTPAHFQRFVGERVRVELLAPRDGRRRYTGRLHALTGQGIDQGIELIVDGAMVSVPFTQIGRARLAPLWS